MAWQDDYQQASFRGVEFFIPSHEGRGGHRVQVTELPGQDIGHTEDFGKKTGGYTLDAYVIGDDYNIQKNLLIQALDKGGNGKLVHPYDGTFQVKVTDYSWRDSVRELNMARFSISVVHAGATLFPTNVVDTKSDVALKKQAAIDALQADFEDRYSITDKVISFATTTQAAIDKVFTTMEDSKRTVSDVSSYRRDLDNSRGRLIALSYDAAELIENITDLIGFGSNADDDFEATSDNAPGTYEDMTAITVFEPDETLTEDADDPTTVVSEATQLSAIIIQAGILSFIEFESADAAEEIRTEVFNLLDFYMESTLNDDVYISLYNLRTSVTEDIDNRIRTLPRLVNHTPIVTMPALVISNELYGNIDKEQEIIERNKISHPGFVPGQVPLEVLLDAA